MQTKALYSQRRVRTILSQWTQSLLPAASCLFIAFSPSRVLGQAVSSPEPVSQPIPVQHTPGSDPAVRSTTFVEVEKGVKLEVIDWGGTGRPVVLLAGLGNTAHVFDSFAPKLTPKYHVYGITRRGFGASSSPSSGYEADRLGDDVLAVLSALNLTKPVLIGHSIAGEELSSIGTRHPDRVAGLIYLEATYSYAYQDPTSADMKSAFDAQTKRLITLAGAAPTASDMANFPSFQAWNLRVIGVLIPEADFHETFESGEDGHLTKRRIAPAVPQAILAGARKYTGVKAVPVLAICSIPHAYGQDFGKSDPAAAAKFIADEEKLLDEQATLFQSGNPSAHVVRMAHANHYVYLSNGDDVMREVNTFISTLPQP